MESSQADVKAPAPKSNYDLGRVVVAAVSGPLGLLGISFLFGLVILAIAYVNPGWKLSDLQAEDERIFNVVFSGLIYVLTLSVLWLMLGKYLFSSNAKAVPAFRALGLEKSVKLSDIGIAIITFAGYLVTSIMVIAVLSQIPGFDIDQPQDIGQSQPEMLSAYVIAFIGLVVLPPLYEELIFRGFMFGALRRQVSFWVSTVLVSLAFAAVHGQLNVAVDTFVLSVFLCALRERTGSIWAPIFVHALKNGLAFMVLFSPYTKSLLGS